MGQSERHGTAGMLSNPVRVVAIGGILLLSKANKAASGMRFSSPARHLHQTPSKGRLPSDNASRLVDSKTLNLALYLYMPPVLSIPKL